MTWEELAQIVRQGVSYPMGSLVQLPYKGKLEWFRVIDRGMHWDTDTGPTPSLTLELEHIWEPTKIGDFTQTRDWRDERERYSEYLERIKKIHGDLDGWWFNNREGEEE